MPNHIICMDASEFGLGGYSLTTWHWEVPLKDQQQKSINFLEFLACIMGIMISIVAGKGALGDCYLSMGDNTSLLGWLHKSNFAADSEQACTHKNSPSLWQTTHSAYLTSGFQERIMR